MRRDGIDGTGAAHVSRRPDLREIGRPPRRTGAGSPVTLLLVVPAVPSALILGALWGLYCRLGDRTEGFVLAAGGGALILAALALIGGKGAH